MELSNIESRKIANILVSSVSGCLCTKWRRELHSRQLEPSSTVTFQRKSKIRSRRRSTGELGVSSGGLQCNLWDKILLKWCVESSVSLRWFNVTMMIKSSTKCRQALGFSSELYCHLTSDQGTPSYCIDPRRKQVIDTHKREFYFRHLKIKTGPFQCGSS